MPPMFRLSHTAEAIYTALCEHVSLYSVLTLTTDYTLLIISLPSRVSRSVSRLSCLDDVVVHVDLEVDDVQPREPCIR